VQVYKEILPDILLPPKPVLTRWGTWLEAAIFNCDNFQDIKKLLKNQVVKNLQVSQYLNLKHLLTYKP
jgi:hypothetical protein